MTDHDTISIVVPTYKEVENVPILVPQVFQALQSAGLSGEMILVDDNSRDGTVEALAKLAETYPVRLITRETERGLSSAVIRGFDEAKNPILLCMDADLSHPPGAVPEVIRPVLESKADFVIGSRYVQGGSTKDDWGLFRRLNSGVATWLARPLTAVRDPMAGFFCLRRETYQIAKSAGLDPIGYKIGLEILIKSRCRRAWEVPIVFSDRMHGKSKLTWRQQAEYLYHLMRLYRFKFLSTG